jgi:hypothetical protein
MAKTMSRFKVDLPNGWEDQTVYHFRGPDIDGNQHLIILTVDRHLRDDDIVAFAQDRISPIEDNLQGLEVLKKEEVTIEDGNPVFEFVYRWIPGEGIRMFQKYIFVIKDDMGFSFSGSFSKKSLKMLGGQMKELVDSLLPGTYEPLEED